MRQKVWIAIFHVNQLAIDYVEPIYEGTTYNKKCLQMGSYFKPKTKSAICLPNNLAQNNLQLLKS